MKRSWFMGRERRVESLSNGQSLGNRFDQMHYCTGQGIFNHSAKRLSTNP
jgi:hypothetical protein